MVERTAEPVMRRALPIYVALVLAFLTAAGVILLARLEHVLLILFISVLFAAALSGPTEYLERVRIPRALAVPLIYLAAMALAIGVIWLVTPPLFDEAADFGEAAPGYVERYDAVRDAYEGLRERYPSLGPFDERVSRIGEAIAERAGQRAFELPSALFALFLDLLSIFVISPVVEGDQLDIHPLLVFVSVLVGGALLGVAGAFVAVPAAAMFQVLYEEVIRPWRRAQLAGVE